jgi:hypothetical protein
VTREAYTQPQCSTCKKPCDPNHPGTLHAIEAWERKAPATSRRSGSDVVLRTRVSPGKYLCWLCADRAKRKVAPLQGGLLESAA